MLLSYKIYEFQRKSNFNETYVNKSDTIRKYIYLFAIKILLIIKDYFRVLAQVGYFVGQTVRVYDKNERCLNMITYELFKQHIENIVKIEFGKTIEYTTDSEKYYAISKAIILIMSDDWGESLNKQVKTRQAFYLSSEFLMGRALSNNLLNLGIDTQIKDCKAMILLIS